MSQVANDYVQHTATGGWRIAGSRVSLDSVVQAYWEGKSPEAIAEEFANLAAEQVYGAIAFYLGHRGEIDGYLAHQEARWDQLRQTSQTQHGPLLDRIRAGRKPSTSAE